MSVRIPVDGLFRNQKLELKIKKLFGILAILAQDWMWSRHVVCELTLVSGLDHYNVLVFPSGITTNIKHVLPAHLLKTSTSVTSR